MNHPKRDSLLGVNTKIQQPSSAKEPKSQISSLSTSAWDRHSFTVTGDPMGKPRMTRRDVWKKRPVVLRYREYCDRIRAAGGKIPNNAYSIIVFAYIAMPSSWSKKRQAEMDGQLHRQKFDADNCVKAVMDALFKEDSMVAGCCCWKFWCKQGQARTEIHVLYFQ